MFTRLFYGYNTGIQSTAVKRVSAVVNDNNLLNLSVNDPYRYYTIQTGIGRQIYFNFFVIQCIVVLFECFFSTSYSTLKIHLNRPFVIR